MTHEKIIKDARGTIRIECKLIVFDRGTDISGHFFNYLTKVWHTPPGKRKEIYCENIATQEEEYAAKNELWIKLKP